MTIVGDTDRNNCTQEYYVWSYNWFEASMECRDKGGNLGNLFDYGITVDGTYWFGGRRWRVEQNTTGRRNLLNNGSEHKTKIHEMICLSKLKACTLILKINISIHEHVISPLYICFLTNILMLLHLRVSLLCTRRCCTL